MALHNVARLPSLVVIENKEWRIFQVRQGEKRKGVEVEWTDHYGDGIAELIRV